MKNLHPRFSIVLAIAATTPRPFAATFMVVRNTFKNFLTMIFRTARVHPLIRPCLIALTCMALMVGCGNENRESRESATAQLAQRGMTNSPEAELVQANGNKEGVKASGPTNITPVETPPGEDVQIKAREQLARLNLKFPDDFMRCVKNNDSLAVKFFLESGINTEQRDNTDGWTALQNAAYKGNPKMVQLLLDHGANVFASKDGDGRWRAEEIAREWGHREVVDLLVAATKQFRASLGSVPGTYIQVEDAVGGAKTNEWIFTEEGTFKSYWGNAGNPDDLRFDGAYQLDGNQVLLRFQLVASGGRDTRQLAVTATGLSDRYYKLVKLPNEKSSDKVELRPPQERWRPDRKPKSN